MKVYKKGNKYYQTENEVRQLCLNKLEEEKIFWKNLLGEENFIATETFTQKKDNKTIFLFYYYGKSRADLKKRVSHQCSTSYREIEL